MSLLMALAFWIGLCMGNVAIVTIPLAIFVKPLNAKLYYTITGFLQSRYLYIGYH